MEDKLVNQKVITLMLQNIPGFFINVVIAKNGLEAIQNYSDKSFDLILMDIQMPELDGISTVEYLRENYLSLPPIIAISAHVLPGSSTEETIYNLMDDFIEKPVRREIFTEKITFWLKKQYSLNKAL